MIFIPHAKSPGDKGHWWWFRDRIVLSCPKCGTAAALDHEISPDGVVSPSVFCSISSCGFHDHIKLEDF